MSSILIIKIDESLNNHHFENDHSILNMQPQSSQTLGLQIIGYRFKSSCSPNMPQIYGCNNGRGFSWLLVAKKCNLSTTIITTKKRGNGCWFS
jgi:hypothetical protein